MFGWKSMTHREPKQSNKTHCYIFLFIIPSFHCTYTRRPPPTFYLLYIIALTHLNLKSTYKIKYAMLSFCIWLVLFLSVLCSPHWPQAQYICRRDRHALRLLVFLPLLSGRGCWAYSTTLPYASPHSSLQCSDFLSAILYV